MKSRLEKFHGTEIAQSINRELTGPIPLDRLANSGFILKDKNNPPSVGRFKSEQFETKRSKSGCSTKVGKLECIQNVFVLHISFTSGNCPVMRTR